MKIAIIGNDKNAANFIKDCEIVNDYLEADLIIFAGNVNWRSAVTKFNKITSKQKVLALGKCCNFINKRFNIRTVDVRFSNKFETTWIYFDDKSIQAEAILDIDKCPILTENYNINAQKTYADFNLGHIETAIDADFIRLHNIPIIYTIYKENHPKYICAQLNPNIFLNSTVSNLLNEIICL